jgi:3',5'-cyclic AMP phosphodiesterase CpdA
MRIFTLVLFCLFSAVFLVSCNFDATGFVISSDVDNRFADNGSLPEKTDLSIPEADFSFIVISDTHVYQGANSRLVALRNKILPEDKFILICGDITQCGYREDYEAFCNYLTQTGLPYYTAIGNHDLYFNGWNNYQQVIGRSCYSFSAGSIRIISMDSANGTIGHRQKEWLENVLKTKTEPLCFVFTHFEFFSAKFPQTQQYSDIEEIYYLMRLFETYGVDYIFMGHSHLYSHQEINNVVYLNVPDLSDGGGQSYTRVRVNGTAISYELLSL